MSERRTKRGILALLLCLCLSMGLLPVGALAASTATVKIDLTVDYSAAYQELEMLNEVRRENGLGDLVMDKNMMEMALLRAAESAVYLSHTRPNGQPFDTARPAGSPYEGSGMGENLLFGGGSIGPSKATEEWYNSEGHRANMLGDYQSVGIACVRDVRGNTYWVQNFTTAAATPESTPSSGTERYFFSVEVAEAYMNVQVIQAPQSMETGEKALVYVTNGEAPVVPTIIETSDESVVSLSMENGGVCISAVGAGTAALTLGFGGHSTTVTVTVKQAVLLEGISLVKPADGFNVKVGDTIYTMVSFQPNGAPECAIEWQVDDPSIASVKATAADKTAVSITGLKAGTTTLKATTAQPVNGQYLTTSVTLTVYARGSGAAATGVSVTAKELDMVPGQQLRVRSYVQPSTADQQVVWSSRDPEVATVDQNGVITAIANGGAVITVSTPDGAFTNRINVRVVDSYTGKPIFFTDVKEGDYCYDAVTWAYCQNMAESEDTTFFGAATPCTRLELVLYLWQLMGGPEPEDIYGPYFTDLPAHLDRRTELWAIQWAVENGITTGTSATTFSPDMTVTRSQAVTFLYRLAGSPSVGGSAGFTDVPAGDWFADAAVWAVKTGLTNGTGNNTFTPNRECSRGEILTFLYRKFG